jgi:hypothetical protein
MSIKYNVKYFIDQWRSYSSAKAFFRRPLKSYDVRRRPRIFKIIRSLLDLRAYLQYSPLFWNLKK